VGTGWASPWIFKTLAKKVVFLVSSGKKRNFATFHPPRNSLEKSPSGPPLEKNPSDTHDSKQCSDGEKTNTFDM